MGAEAAEVNRAVPGATRRNDFDALRALAVLALLVYHSARPFDLGVWHVKDRTLSVAIEVFGQLLTPWRLPLLFMISGAATWHALRTRSVGAYARDRFLRLMVPLAFGMVVIVPPQVYVERLSHGMPHRQSPIDFTGSYLEFQRVAFSGVYPQGNFSWHHLWFLVYLFVISLAALPLLRWLRTPAGERHRQRLIGVLATPVGVFLPALLIVAIHVALRGRFPSTHALVGDWWNLAHYAVMFVLGYVVVADARFRVAVERVRHVAALAWIAIAIARIVWFLTMPPAPAYSGAYVVALTLRGGAEWPATGCRRSTSGTRP